MASRYQEVFRLKQRLYLDGSPVLIEAGALQKDSAMNKILAQVKYKSISAKSIIACKASILAYEIGGSELEGVKEFQYLDLNVEQGDYFGSKVPIYLPDNGTRSFAVIVNEVVFADKSTWHSDEGAWFEIPVQTKIMDRYHDLEMLKQYEIEVGNDSSFVPIIEKGLFRCTCGTENMESSSECYKCHRTYDDLSKVFDESYLKERKDERLKNEEEQRSLEELAKKEKEQKRREAEELAAEEQIIKTEKTKVSLVYILILLILIAGAAFGIHNQLSKLKEIEVKHVEQHISDIGRQFDQVSRAENGLTYMGKINGDIACCFSSDNKVIEVLMDNTLENSPTNSMNIVSSIAEYNYEIVEYSDNKFYVVAAKVGDTLLYLSGEKESKDKLVQFAKDFGYYPK